MSDDRNLLNDGALAECPVCGDLCPAGEVVPRRMNTQYHDEASNYMESCLPCWEYSEFLWAAQWADYYAGLL